MWRDQCRQFGGTVKGAGSIGVQILSAVSIQMSLILPPTVCWIWHGGLGQMMIGGFHPDVADLTANGVLDLARRPGANDDRRAVRLVHDFHVSPALAHP